MELERIVVGVDFSPESEVAVEHAVSLGRISGAEVLLLHVRELVEIDDRDVKSLLAREQKEAHDRLSALRERHGANLSQALVDGSPAAAITGAAAEVDASLTVIGTHGRTGLRRFLLGSVAEKVVRRASSHVLVVRRGRAGPYERILVATDFSPPAEEALATAIDIAAPGAQIDLVHYWQIPGGPSGHYMPLAARPRAYERLAATIEAAAWERGDPLLDRFRNERVAIELSIQQGIPAVDIVTRAGGYDLICMGRRGVGAFERWLTGSVTAATVRHAPCSVLIARDRREP